MIFSKISQAIFDILVRLSKLSNLKCSDLHSGDSLQPVVQRRVFFF